MINALYMNMNIVHEENNMSSKKHCTIIVVTGDVYIYYEIYFLTMLLIPTKLQRPQYHASFFIS